MMYHNRNGTSRATSSAPWYRIRLQLAPEVKWLAVLLLLAVAVVSVSACTSSPTPTASPTPTSPTPATTPTTTPPTSTPPASPTFGQLADSGKTIFANSCAKCHGNNGQGVTAPAVIGSGAALGKYNTAQGLLSFLSSSMPLDAPRSLSQQQYQQVLCYLLVQNNFASASNPFDASQLGNIALK